MRTQIRIVAGALRGRKLTVNVNPEMRPTPQMVREALFSILGNAVPERPFLDVFAGTGIVGLEALSRGAASAVFVERDLRLAQEIERNVRSFDLGRRTRLLRTDAYRWVSSWRAPAEPVNIFVSPPFPDLSQRSEDLLRLLQELQKRVADGSVIVLQSERGAPLEEARELADWEQRRYSRNVLMLWQKDESGAWSANGHADAAEPTGEDERA